MKTAVLRMKGRQWSYFQLLAALELDPVSETMLAWVWLQQVVGFAADSAPSACATSVRRSETLLWDSTQLLSEPLGPSLWAAEGAASSKLAW